MIVDVSKEYDEFLAIVKEMCSSRLYKEHSFTQHGNTSCLKHSIAVAYYSFKIAKILGKKYFSIKELVRGALLHDYFLYDWHKKPIHEKNGLHGFSHPLTAWQNAKNEFKLTARETDIIKNHMFPLTIKPPRCRESVIVTLVDKYCSTYEVFSRNTYNTPTIKKAMAIILGRKTAKKA